jgi:hypothetical protein
MKIQCSCGAKYSFDVTPDNVAQPVRFVCPACGVDSSDLVNDLIRREFAAATPAPEPPAAAAPRLKISHAPAPAAAPAATPPADASGTFCSKHPNEIATEHCAVCHKPICPQCLALFGFFCSPYCKSKADAASLKVPAYAGLGTAVDARFRRTFGRVLLALVFGGLLAFGFGLWYEFYAAQPRPAFTVTFADRASAGASRLIGTDQLIFLHGGTLARCNLTTQQTLWSQEIIPPSAVDAIVAHLQELQSDNDYRKGVLQLQKIARTQLESALSLQVNGSNIWVSDANQLTEYDWSTGHTLQTIPWGPDHNLMSASPDQPGGGLPSANGTPGQPLDPNKVADQAQNLTTPALMALPALLANNAHQQQLMAAMRDDDPAKARPAAPAAPTGPTVALFSSAAGPLQCTVTLVTPHFVTRNAMRTPDHSVVNGDLNAGQGTAAANEILNEMQRNNGGGQITEDDSLYSVTLRYPGNKDVPAWTGQVTGRPVLYLLKSVNVIAAGASVTVLDPGNKLLWAATLTYPVTPARTGPDGEASPYGYGPGVEQAGTLYVADEAVLTAFDLATGNARWRLPSVGIVGLLFDDSGGLYVNTTTASPDKIKYARQIDITESIDSILLKVDTQTGRSLWSSKTGGFASYVAGPYLYTIQSHDEPVDDMASDLTSGLEKPSFLKLFRLNPKNGNILWEYDDDQAPLDVCFDRNRISLVFHTKVQVLKYLSL